MALIKCSECGREISDKAAACIHCGCPISESKPTSFAGHKVVYTGNKTFNEFLEIIHLFSLVVAKNIS